MIPSLFVYKYLFENYTNIHFMLSHYYPQYVYGYVNDCDFCEWQDIFAEYLVSLHKWIETHTKITYVLGYTVLKTNTNTGCDKTKHPHLTMPQLFLLHYVL